MSRISAADIRTFIVLHLARNLESSGRTLSSDLPDDFDLFKEGVIDSLGMINLTAEIEEHFGREIDFADLDPEQMTVVGPLCRYIENRLN